jgi:hypothetical protein
MAVVMRGDDLLDRAAQRAEHVRRELRGHTSTRDVAQLGRVLDRTFPMPCLSGSNIGLMCWLYTRLARRRRMVQTPTIRAEGLHLPRPGRLRCGCPVPDGRRLCPACGSALATLDDVVERARERTLDERGRLETVHGRAATQLAEAGADWAPCCGFG